MVIIVGLGNIGVNYNNTFHNIGFRVVDKVAEKIGASFTKEKYKSIIAEGKFEGHSIMLCKPTTFMNNSGEALTLIKKKI